MKFTQQAIDKAIGRLAEQDRAAITQVRANATRLGIGALVEACDAELSNRAPTAAKATRASPKASAKAAEIEQVARDFLQHVVDQRGEWVQGSEAFKAAAEKNEGLSWVSYTKEKPKARTAITPVIDRLLQDEFPQVEREKRGTKPGSPVFFRLRPQL
jgi:hypothetical protein